MTKELAIILLKRFIRSFLAGAVANMITVISFSGSNWHDIGVWLSALALSGFVGGASGLIMALDKYLRSND